MLPERGGDPAGLVAYAGLDMRMNEQAGESPALQCLPGGIKGDFGSNTTWRPNWYRRCLPKICPTFTPEGCVPDRRCMGIDDEQKESTQVDFVIVFWIEDLGTVFDDERILQGKEDVTAAGLGPQPVPLL